MSIFWLIALLVVIGVTIFYVKKASVIDHTLKIIISVFLVIVAIGLILNFLGISTGIGRF